MKTAALLTLLAISAFAGDTNVIDLKRQPFAITNLQGKAQSGLLLSADLDGVLYQMPPPNDSWRNRISYTNLSPTLLEKWGIPTNRIQIAKKRAEEKATANKKYNADLAEQRRQMAEQNAEAQQIAAIQDADAAVARSKKEKAERIADLKQRIPQLETDRDAAFNSWLHCSSDFAQWNNGVLVDSEQIRHARYQRLDRELRQAKDELSELRH